MTVNIAGSVSGTAQTGLTTPSYNTAVDTPPNPNGKQWYVTSCAGTQPGVIPHSVSSPFTIAQFRPPVYRGLGSVNPVTGSLQSVPTNVYKTVTRKGVLVLAGQPPRTMVITTMIEVPAGADLADPNSVRAALSMHLGSLSSVSAGLGDSTIQGTI